MKNKNIEKDIQLLEDDLDDMDYRLVQNEQYTRRENQVISGIPNRVSQKDLQNTVLRIIN